MQSCQNFLKPKNPIAAVNAAQAITQNFKLLLEHPLMGRPFEDEPDLRELLIPFGETGYTALYKIEGDFIIILAFRHMKEAGY